MRYNKFLKISVLAILVGMGTCGLLYNVGAEAAQEGKDIVRENKTLAGEVGFINSEFIAIIDYRDDEAGTEPAGQHGLARRVVVGGRGGHQVHDMHRVAAEVVGIRGRVRDLAQSDDVHVLVAVVIGHVG